MRARTSTFGRIVATLVSVAGASAVVRASSPSVTPVNTGADAALQLLRDGNARFASGQGQGGDERARVAMAGESVSPFAVVLTASDSRLPAERIFDRGVGDVYVLRTPVVIVDDAALWGVNYAARELGVPLVLVLVPTRGDVLSALDAMPESMARSRRSVAEAVDRARLRVPSGEGRAYTMALGEELAWRGAEDLLSGGKSVARRVREKRLRVEAALYDLDTGVVAFMGPHPREGELVEKAIYREALERAGMTDPGSPGILSLAGDEGTDEIYAEQPADPVVSVEETAAIEEPEPVEIEKPAIEIPAERAETPEATFTRSPEPRVSAPPKKPPSATKPENAPSRRSTDPLGWIWWALGGLVGMFGVVWLLMREKPEPVAGRVGAGSTRAEETRRAA